MDIDDNSPIIVGVAQKTWREIDCTRTPVDALYEVSASAISDAGTDQLSGAIDALAMVRFIGDTDPGVAALFPRNPGRQIAARLGMGDVSIFQGIIGGNTPQSLVNHFAGKLTSGEHTAVMISGAELLATLFGALASGDDISAWAGEPEEEPTTIGTERDGLNDTEKMHGLYEPISTYPLFESSLRHHLGRSFEEHQAHIAKLCSTMSQVAAENPHAWRPEYQDAETIATPSASNRFIGYPYTKAMNPVLAVDMAASVVMTTAGKARELGINPDQWIYLRGGVDLNDIWHISERPSLHESPAIRLAWRSLSENTGLDIDALTDFDIYSCFPSAVQVACNEIGLSPLDARGVTVTGGLPYLGGPGNNYSLHAIAEMVSRLRSRGKGHGLVTANGLYLTKHSLGLYSTEPPEAPWKNIDSQTLQAQIEAGPRLKLATETEGEATLEAYTVGFGRQGPKFGLVIARNAAGERIMANTDHDPDTLSKLMKIDQIDCKGKISVKDGKNIFTAL